MLITTGGPATAAFKAAGDRLKDLHGRLRGLDAYAYLLLVAVTALAWTSQGLRIGAFKLEDYGLLMDHGADGALLDPLWPRLFRDVPVWLGLHLMPHGFQGWQLMLLLLTALRSALVYSIVKAMLPERALFALACGLLAAFHPADSGYFFVNTTGVQSSVVLALAGCRFALAYLESGRKSALWACYAFQVLSVFTYSGFVPLMVALPAGLWLLRLAQRRRLPWQRLLKLNLVFLLLLALQLVLIARHTGRDAKVADFDAGHILDGYRWAFGYLYDALPGMVSDYAPAYLPLLAVVGILALVACFNAKNGTPAEGTRRWSRVDAVIVAGFLGLAAACYLPYAVSTLRFGINRQLMGLGMFGYAALVYLAMRVSEGRRWNKYWQAVCVLLVALVVMLAGLEKREQMAERYRGAELPMSLIAQAVPRPRPGSFILVRLHVRKQMFPMIGLYSRQDAFQFALQFQYGTLDVDGAFMGLDPDSGRLTPAGAYATIQDYQDQSQELIPYDRLLLVDLPAEGGSHLVTRDELAHELGVDPAKLDYAPAADSPAGAAPNTCTVLEKDYQPAYCSMRED